MIGEAEARAECRAWYTKMYQTRPIIMQTLDGQVDAHWREFQMVASPPVEYFARMLAKKANSDLEGLMLAIEIELGWRDYISQAIELYEKERNS